MPDISLLGQLAAVLRISVAELMSGELMSGIDSSLIVGQPVTPDAQAYAQPVVLAPQQPTNTVISPYLFGSNLEHTRSCIYHGLFAQLLRNRKFAVKPSIAGCAIEWFPIGEQAFFAFTDPYTRHAQQGYHMQRLLERNAQQVHNLCAGQMAGIGQHGLCV